jgi:hypothetical protein
MLLPPIPRAAGWTLHNQNGRMMDDTIPFALPFMIGLRMNQVQTTVSMVRKKVRIAHRSKDHGLVGFEIKHSP